jgi:hypothetical protein
MADGADDAGGSGSLFDVIGMLATRFGARATNDRRHSTPTRPATTLGRPAVSDAWGPAAEARTPTAANPASATVPAPGRRRDTRPRTIPNTAANARIPTTSASLSLAPKVSMAKRSTDRGTRLITSPATASTGDASPSSRPAISSPAPSARPAETSPANAAAGAPAGAAAFPPSFAARGPGTSRRRGAARDVSVRSMCGVSGAAAAGG